MSRFIKIGLIIFGFFNSKGMYAQGCAMCKAAVEKGEKESFNDAILYLMMFPYIIAAFAIGLFIYLLRKKKVIQES